MIIRESAENYLESILCIQQELGECHATRVAEKMGVTKASVSNAMKSLRDNGYITVNEEGHILLTRKGLDIAEAIYERHNVLTRALMALGVSEETASADACLIEHDLSDESFECLKRHMTKMKHVEEVV